jgi:hypothetical protein
LYAAERRRIEAAIPEVRAPLALDERGDDAWERPALARPADAVAGSG